MRDLLVTALIFGSLPFILARPYIGILVWSWVSYMNPHRLTWGFAYDFPFAQIVAIVLLASLVFSAEKKRIPFDGLLFVWILFIIWMTVTTIFAFHSDYAFEAYTQVIKIQALTFVTLMVMSSPKRVDMLIWVMCFSIGFFSIKGGLFTILSGGGYRVYGPPNSFIEENNALGLATLMMLPLMYYLYTISEAKWLRWGVLTSMVLSGASVLGSQSRGALVAIIALSGYFWLQTKTKIISGVAIILVVFISLTLMPQSWEERMDSIRNYQDDPSAMSRINAWIFSVNVANDRLTGGGFNSFSVYTYEKYNPAAGKVFVAHSIYFSVLAAHGWPGLVMYLLILFFTWRNLSRIVKRTRGDPDLTRYHTLARMLRLSLIAYMAGGAFLSLAYFDLPWHVIAIAYLTKHQLAAALEGREDKAELPAGRPSMPVASR